MSVCFKCKTELDLDSTTHYVQVVSQTDSAELGSSSESKSYDLCETCKNEVKAFIEGAE